MSRLAECVVHQRQLYRALGLADTAAARLMRPRPAPGEVRSLLFVCRRGLGDVLLLLPALRHARRLFRHARIQLWTDGAYVRFLREADLDIEVAPLQARRVGGKGGDCFDAALAFHADPRILWRVRRHARWLAGYSGRGSTCLLDCVLPDRRDIAVSQRYLLLVSAMAGALSVPAADLRPVEDAADLAVAAPWRAAAEALWPAALQPPVVIHPGCGTRAKRWSTPGWRELMACCRRQGWPVALTGSARDRALCAELAGGSGTTVTNLAGLTDWSALAGLLARARAVVAPDTGVIHLARALGTPTISLFGPASPAIWGAAGWGEGHDPRHRSLARPLPCSYCERTRCPRLSARSRALSFCMQAIWPEEVWRALLAVADHPAPREGVLSRFEGLTLYGSTSGR